MINPHTPPPDSPHKLRPILRYLQTPLYRVSSSKASHLTGCCHRKPKRQATPNKRWLVETSVEAAAMVAVKARVMAAAMPAADATAMAATTVVAAATAVASDDSCGEEICVVDAAAGAMTAAASSAVKGAAR